MTNLELEKKVKELETKLDESVGVLSRMGQKLNRYDEIISSLKDENDRLKPVVDALKLANNTSMKILADLTKVR
jgi:SMC interacting uncharacterized protein involved in chromosome segregation